MRRGSVSTWETFGRRSSANMAQYIGGPAQFMTSDDIKYRPTDGWFISYKKATSIVIFIIFILIVVGLIGWYGHTTPTKRVHDAFSLINGESTKEMAKPSHISSHIRPLKYWLYFKPTIMDYNNNNNNNNNNDSNSNSNNNSSVLMGRVVIKFEIDSSNRLQKLSLNAINITMKRYELSFLIDEDSKVPKKRYKRENETNVIVKNIENENDTMSDDKNSTIVSMDESNKVIVKLENDPNILLENGTTYGEEETGLVPANGTLPFDFKVSKIKDDWFSVNGIGKGDEIVQIKEYEIDQVNGLHVIRPTEKLKRGVYFLMIDFEANPTNDVFYVVDSSFNEENKRMMGTLLKTAEASRLFPLFDEIYLRAIFSLSVERPKEMRVLSNMPLRSTKDASDNCLIDTFNDTPPISPHNLAFVVGNLEALIQTLINSKIFVTFWAEFNTTSQGFYLLNKVEPTIVGLTDILSISYWLPKLDLVCLPWKIVRSSGNPGLITMRKSLFYADDRSPLVTRTEALKTLIGLLGEQWLGGRVNVKSWTNAWILEGSLLYFQHLLIEKIDPSLGFAHSFVTDVETKAMESDGYDSSRSFQVKINPLRIRLLSMARNMRGACLIRMLHATISNDTAFRIAYKKLLTSQDDGSVDATEFWNFMNEEVKEFPDNLSPKEIIDTWISQTGYPLVTVLRNYEEGSAIVRQKKFSYDVPTAERNDLWHIPLTYVGIDDDWSSPKKEWLEKEREQIFYNVSTIDEKNQTGWILFNVNKTGYYRVNYDEKNWRLLAMALDENHEAFPVETRASLVDDVFALAAVGSSKYETAFGFIKYMQIKERHYAPWSAFAHHVFKLNNVLYETSAFLDFQEFLQKLITPLYNEVIEKLEEGSPLTLFAVKLACLSEHPKCLDWAKQSFVELKRNPFFKHTIPMYIRRTLYCTIARHGGHDEWNYLYQKARNSMKTEEKYNLLSSFGCFQIPGVLQSIIDEILQDDIYNDDEICMILKSFSKNPIASRMAYKFIMRNWKNILKRFHDSYSIIRSFILAMMNSVTNEQDLMDLHTFWESNYESIKTIKYAAALVEAKANFAISLIKNYSQDIKEWLKDNNDSGV
ncbi:aminopeptidase N-like isoform X2 [Vespa crabro]|uniref:aminopeptidase N-like isoform X2 n=1 Tax=Vespa crabro TaxID=7445 RepID=UPI001F01DEFB|nr:aminopeptidase N-like isoform X2 [Vespa crabro]